MNIDYVASIKYIKENFQDMNLTGADLEKLNKLLDLLKAQVQQEIISKVVQGDESVRQEIQEAKKTLEERKAFLSEQRDKVQEDLEYPEFQAQEAEEGVAPVLQARTEKADKKRYSAKKEEWEKTKKPHIEDEIRKLQDMIDRLSKCIESLDKPEEFIQSLLEQELNLDKNSQRYQELVNHCATTMASGYMEMENVGGLGSLFSKTGQGNFDGYTINPEAVTKFLSVVRNPEMLKELRGLSNAYAEYWQNQRCLASNEKTLKEEEDKLSKTQIKKEIFDDPEISSDVEKRITSLLEKVIDNMDIDRELSKLNLPVSNNFFSRLINNIRTRIFPNTTVEAKKSELLNRNVQNNQGISIEWSELVKKRNEDDRFNISYMTYYDVAAELNGRAPLSSHMMRTSDNREEVARFMYLNGRLAGKTLHEFVKEKSGLDSKSIEMMKQTIEGQKEIVADLRTKTETSRENILKAFNELSPEAKALHDVKEGDLPTPVGPIDYWERKYVNADENLTRYNANPFVSSLILEALLKAGDIKTPEDAAKLGIEISPETIAKKRLEAEKISDEIKTYTQGVAEQGKKLEEKYTEKDDEDAR